MSHCIGHTQCPECVKLGKDNGRDNLALYSDGGCYCFSCGFSESSAGLQKLKQRTPTVTKGISLPSDVSEYLPARAWDYLGQYSLTKQDCVANTILWSDFYSRLVFPYFDSTGLLAWQGRYLGDDPDKAKWFSQGNLNAFYHIVGNTKSRTVVLVEDIVSAIKVGQCGNVAASPLFGSHVSTKRILYLKHFYDTILVWLDMDKAKESVKFSKTARDFGVMSRSIITEKDPKLYSTQEILLLTQED
jgi:hypothetical protein